MSGHKILRGTLEEEKAADVEYVLRPYMNTSHKRLELSKTLPWKEDDTPQAPKDKDIEK